jgi:hypothetical protein
LPNGKTPISSESPHQRVCEWTRNSPQWPRRQAADDPVGW